MKKLLSLLLVCIIVVSGCSNNDNNSTTSDSDEKSGTTESKAKEDSKTFSLEKKIDQLGGKTFSSKGLNQHSFITDKDGYTYILTLDINSPERNNANAILYVSVIKGEEILLKEKQVDLTDIIGVDYINHSLQYSINHNNFLLTATVFDSKTYKYEEKLITLNVDEEGNIDPNIVKEAYALSPSDQFVTGLGGTYFKACFGKLCDFIDIDGKTIESIKGGGLYDMAAELFWDESLGRIYLNDRDRNPKQLAVAFDIEKNDTIKNKDGSEKLYTIPSNDTIYIGTDNGFYGLQMKTHNQRYLYYYENVNGEPVQMSKMKIVPTTPTLKERTKKVKSNHITLDGEYIYVYRSVVKNNQVTLEKNIYTIEDKAN